MFFKLAMRNSRRSRKENGFVTMYLHNSSLAVSVGDVVSQGQTIAYAGSTGYSTGTHCHFSVFLNGSYVNPLDYL